MEARKGKTNFLLFLCFYPTHFCDRMYRFAPTPANSPTPDGCPTTWFNSDAEGVSAEWLPSNGASLPMCFSRKTTGLLCPLRALQGGPAGGREGTQVYLPFRRRLGTGGVRVNGVYLGETT